uniref:Uncharacterized protein n=1 Tax=Anguilla anguilla TaxID=7936 RepID=A0A0E9UYC4_ANGAN
MRYTRVLPRVE